MKGMSRLDMDRQELEGKEEDRRQERRERNGVCDGQTEDWNKQRDRDEEGHDVDRGEGKEE